MRGVRGPATGGTGFIGPHLARRLARAGSQVRWPDLAIIIAVCAAGRMLVLYFMPGLWPEPGYTGASEQIAKGVGFWWAASWLLGPASGCLRTPTYPILLAILSKASGSNPILMAVGHQAFGLATALLLYYMGSRVWGRRCGLVAALVYSVDPGTALFDGLGLSETPMAALVLGSLALSLPLLESSVLRPGLASATGLCGAAAALCRPGFALFGAVCLLASLSGEKRGFRRPSNGWIAGAVFLGVTIGWMVRNLAFFGWFTLTSNFPLAALGNTYPFVDYSSTRFPEAKAALLEAQHLPPEQGDVPHAAQAILMQRHGMSQPQAARELLGTWREAVLARPGAFLTRFARNISFLSLPPREEFNSQIASLFEDVWPARWPPGFVERMEGLGFYALAGPMIGLSWMWKALVALLSLLGMVRSLRAFLCGEGGAEGFLLVNHLCCLVLFSIATAFTLYHFELHPIQILFAASLFAGRRLTDADGGPR